MLLANDLHTHVLQYYYNHILTEHFGQDKTLELIHCRYTWLFIYVDVKSFYNSCVTCMKSKPQHYKPYGSLKQLPIPKQYWNSISMDFIEKLLSLSKYNTILVVVNWLSKKAIFVLTVDTITLHKLVKLFIIHIFSKYSVLSHVTFNYRLEFVSKFF